MFENPFEARLAELEKILSDIRQWRDSYFEKMDIWNKEIYELLGDYEPEWEYRTTVGPRKRWDDYDTPPDGDGWELDPDRGVKGQSWERFDYTEERYWRRHTKQDS